MRALFGGSIKPFDVIPVKTGIRKKQKSHPEFISGSTKKRCAKLVQHDKDRIAASA
ncbi:MULTISPECIES: hypothetical protein [unclassified Rickettsia]|uniref:hypothetical protein n=1 Tax=unclassified Rickettsia TaxID=114295 RepID=UPI003132E17D